MANGHIIAITNVLNVMQDNNHHWDLIFQTLANFEDLKYQYPFPSSGIPLIFVPKDKDGVS